MIFLGIMQPYFFPYLGYFQLISKTDKWVVFDIVQYNKKTWMNRNRILHPKSGWQYITVPVRKSPIGTPISDVMTVDPIKYLKKINGQLEHYKNHAPYYEKVIDLLGIGFENRISDRLVDLNVSTLSVICDYLEIKFNWKLCSEINLELQEIEKAGDWALKICEDLGATDYINPPGGRGLFDPKDWEKSGIRLMFMEPNDFVYPCVHYQFEKNLSIVDVLMWNHRDLVKDVINNSSACLAN